MAIVPATGQQYSIYRLVDPRDNSTRYIGLSSHIFERYAQHILSSGIRKKGARYEWIKSLKQQNLNPVLNILEAGIENRSQAEEREAYWIRFYRNLGADLTNILEPRRVHVPAPLKPRKRRLIVSMLPATNLRKIRESLGTTQEGFARRTRSIGLRTYIRAENGKRVTYDTASQILDAINEILSEASKPTVTLEDLGLTLY
jgi:hypothetical protein